MRTTTFIGSESASHWEYSRPCFSYVRIYEYLVLFSSAPFLCTYTYASTGDSVRMPTDDDRDYS